MCKQVALILLNFNTPGYTANCIKSLMQYCDDTSFDIIVADNGSSDNSLDILKQQFPTVIYIDNKENLGFAEGNNRAMTYSIDNGYKYSLLINTDTLVDEDIVAKLSAHLNKYPGSAAVQPAIYWMHNKTKLWNGEGRFNKITGTVVSDTTAPFPQQTFKQVDWVTGCCVLLRNSALVKTGLLNNRFFLYYEDVDLSFRLRNTGYGLHYLLSCKMYHEAGVSAKIQASKSEGHLNPIIHYYTSRNHLWILRLYGKPFFYPIYIIYYGVYYLAVLTYLKLRGRNKKVANLIKGLKEGICTPKKLIWPHTL